jgi:hypothetical protein
MMRLFSVLICSVVLIFTSCSKKLLPTSAIEEEYALEKFDFEYLQAKSKIRFSSSDRNLSSSASIRMRKDSIIWVSVSPIFGIEAARGFISQDTIVFMDRVNKDVYRYNYESLSNALNFEINFEMVQSIILGNQVFDFKSEDNFSKRAGELKIGQTRGRFDLETFASSKNRKVKNVKVQEIPDGSRMEIIFSAFNIVANQAFPFNTNFSMSKNDKVVIECVSKSIQFSATAWLGPIMTAF